MALIEHEEPEEPEGYPHPRKKAGEAAQRKKLTPQTASKYGLGAGVALGGLSVGTIAAKQVDWKAWDALLRKAMEALLTQNGPFPVLGTALLVLFVYLYYRSNQQIVNSKDNEINRLVPQRDKLEDMLYVAHPRSGGNGTGNRD